MADKIDAQKKTCFPETLMKKSEWGMLTPLECDELFELSECRKYKPGETVFYQDDECRGLYLIEEGLISVRKLNSDGDGVVLRLSQGGDTLGYRPLLAQQTHHASAVVLKESVICFFAAKQALSVILKNPQFGLAFLRREALELGVAEERFLQTAKESVRTRLIHLILVLHKHFGEHANEGSTVLNLPISRDEMASMIGVRVESLCRSISLLTKERHIECSGRNIRINNIGAMIDEISCL
jgi:CRP-like cAMP-binding protein